MTKVYNKEIEKCKRRLLRKNMPQAEIILWSNLRNKILRGYKFRRQYSVKNFVLDFYCPKLKLAIEVDGGSHFIEGADVRDKERQTIIETFGISFLRFTNKEIQENINGVLEKIMENIQERCIKS